MIFAEPGGSGDFLHQYLQVQFAPDHLLAELGFTIVFELLQFFLIVLLWKKVIKPRLHKEYDEEHGLTHHEDHVHVTPVDHVGCCGNCKGTGIDKTSYESNGRCWDCYGTGHAHSPELSCF